MPFGWTSKDVFKLVLVVGAMLLFGAIIVYSLSTPKEMATPEQVWNVLESQGYEPHDVTQSYAEYPYILNCIETEKDDIKFSFFVCFDEDRATEMYQKYHSIFIGERRFFPYAEYITQKANFAKYGLLSNGKYSIVVQVGSTLVYAESDEANMAKTTSILEAIDYLNH